VNSEPVGADSTYSNSEAVVIIDSLDVFNSDPPIIIDGLEFYELPALFSINAVTGLNAGTQLIVPGTFLTDLSNNFEVSYGLGKMTILKDTLKFFTQATQLKYGETQPEYHVDVSGFKYDDNFGSVIKSLNYSLKDAAGSIKPGSGTIAAGTYQIIPNVELIATELRPGEPVNYVPEFSYGTLTVDQVPLTVKADDKIILAGEVPLYSSTLTGLVNGDTPSSGPNYVSTPPYTNQPGIYTITPSGIEFEVPGNYDITYQNGLLYVNPSDNSAKAIRPILRCVEEVKNDPNYSFIAHFEYQNDNATAVFIPIGPENNLISQSSYSGAQPQLFLPGGGSFDILFKGDKLIWSVTSYDKGKKTSVASEASSTSTRCKKGGGNKGGRESLQVEPEEEIIPEAPLVGYPNPVKETVSIMFPESDGDLKGPETMVMDQIGRSYPVNSEWDQNKNILTIDFSSLQKGMYIIRVSLPENIKVVKVFKD
jgi:hypothetical protein